MTMAPDPSTVNIVTITDIDRRIDSATVCRPLTGALNASNVAINYYELVPGDSFAYGYHAHDAQEEVFIVTSGTVTFETEEGETVVESGEAIRFAPGEYQQGTNTGDNRVEALALGAPQDGGGLDLLRDCETCGERTPHTIEWADDREAKLTVCLNCGDRTGRYD
ncbi:cupin domain-containing protein [Natrinema caseinilyticum]|uniref:cupin domain-containing protein n=1 Tax=Natrinema caseinilyticum TaxID=2961570 RepID=UPI003CCDC88B